MGAGPLFTQGTGPFLASVRTGVPQIRRIQMEKMLKVGVITSTHGIQGEVKVLPTTDDPGRFKLLEHVIVDMGKSTTQLEIERVKFFKKFVILKFKGIDHINDVERYRRRNLLVERENAVPLGEGEYFIADMLGMDVQTEDGVPFGRLKDVIETGANDVYVIASPVHGQVLVPAIRECIRDIDVDQGMMTIHLMEGLI